MTEALLGFPFSLLWAIPIGFLYRSSIKLEAWLAGVGVLLIAGLFLPGDSRAVFWLPGGMASVILVTSVLVTVFQPKNSLQQLLSIELPSRTSLRDVIQKADSPEEKEAVYKKLLKDFSQLWWHRDNLITKTNTRLILALFGLSFILTYTYAVSDYFAAKSLEQFFLKSLENFTKKVPEADFSELKEQILPVLYFISPSSFFIQGGIMVLLVAPLLRAISRYRIKAANPFGLITLYRISEKVIWLFLALGIWVLLSFKISMSNAILFVPVNVFIILCFLYILQGFGIITLFLEVRILPVNWVMLFMAMAGLLFPLLLVLYVFIALLLGLSDFWFDFRKKALHPVRLLNS